MKTGFSFAKHRERDVHGSPWRKGVAALSAVALSVGGIVLAGGGAAYAQNSLPENTVAEGDQVIQDNWNAANTSTAQWPVSSNQKLVRVGTGDPIDLWDINYEGYFVNADGRTVLRLVYNERSVVVSAVWHELVLKLPAELTSKIDWDASIIRSKEGQNTFKLREGTTDEYHARVDNIVDRSAYINNLPISLVLQEGVTFEDLPNANIFVEGRLTDEQFKRIFTWAPGKTSIDYSSYTHSTVIPTASSVDNAFLRGSQHSKYWAEQRSYMSEFIANPDGFDTDANIGIIRSSYEWQHDALAKANTNSSGLPIAYAQVFDASLLDLLKEDPNGCVAQTNLLDEDRKVYVSDSKNYPSHNYCIRKSDINMSGDVAYIVIGEQNFKDANPDVNVVIADQKQMDGGIYEGTWNFTTIDFFVDKTALSNVFETQGTTLIRFPVMAGWLDSNSTTGGWLTFENTNDQGEPIVIPKGQSYLIDTGAAPTGKELQLQIGDKQNALINRWQGYYAASQLAISSGKQVGIDQFSKITDGVYQVALAEGATIATGESIRLIMPDTETHDTKVNFVAINNNGLTDGDAAVFENYENDGKYFYDFPDGKLSSRPTITVKHTPVGGSEVEAKIEYSGATFKKNSDDAGVLDVRGALGTTNFSLDRTKLEPGAPVTVVTTYKDGTSYETTIRFTELKPSAEKIQGLTWSDNTEAISALTIVKSDLLPHQEIFTNDYADGTDEIYVDSRVAPASDEAFVKDATTVEGFVRYDGGSVRMRYIPFPDGDTLVGETQASANEYNDDGELTVDNSKQLSLNEAADATTQYTVYPYTLDLAKLQKTTDAADAEASQSLTLKKDMLLLFNASDGSSLPSDWDKVRVRTRVLFNPTLGTLNTADGTGVKVVPDNAKYYGEEGYTANGFANGVPGTGDAFALNPTPSEGKTFLGWVTKAGVDALKGGTTRSIPEGYSENDFITTAEKYNALEADSQKFTENTPIEMHQVVYAVYSAEELVTFDANGGAFTDGSTQVKDNIADGVNKPADPTLEGKKFVGWATTSDAATADVEDVSNLQAGATVYAVWEEAGDSEKPAAPTVTPAKDGSVTVSPATDAEEVTVTYTDEAGKEQTVTATKGEDGTWTLPEDAPEGVTVDPATGKITLPADAVKDGSEVSATSKVGDTTTDPVTATAGNDPADSDGDDVNDGDEVNGNTASGKPTNPNHADAPKPVLNDDFANGDASAQTTSGVLSGTGAAVVGVGVLAAVLMVVGVAVMVLRRRKAA